MKTFTTYIPFFGKQSFLGLIFLITAATFLPITTVMAQTSSPVEWTDLVGVVADGNNLTKTADAGWENGGAASVQTISGDGGVSALVDKTNSKRMIGLSSTNADASYRTIDYAIYLHSNGSKYVFEKGVNLGNFGGYSTGDRVSVERSGSTVEYKHNGVTFYTSLVASSGSLLVDTSLYHLGATLADVMIIGGDESPTDAQVFDTDVIIGSAGNSADLDVYGNSTFGSVNLDVLGGGLGSPENVDYSAAPFWLQHDGLNLALDGDQLSSDAEPFVIQNTNPNGGIVFKTGAIDADRLTITSSGDVLIEGSVRVSSPAGDIPTITY